MRTQKTWLTCAAAVIAAALFISASPLWAEEPSDSEATPESEAPVESSTEPQETTSLGDADTGVSVQTMCTNCNNADLSMGGLGNEHVAVTSDGLPVPSGLAQIYLLSVMPQTMVDKVAIKKGASEPQLSGASVGGGIQIERRRPQPGMQLNFLADTGGYGWRGSQFDVSGEKGRFGGSLATSWGKSRLVDATSDGNPNLPSFERYTLDGSVEFRLARKQHVRVRGVRYDEAQEDGPAAYDLTNEFLEQIFGLPPTTKYNRENVELERVQYDALYEGQFDDGSSVELSLIVADRRQDIEETGTTFGGAPLFYDPTYFIDDEKLHAGLSWSRPLGQQVMMRAGFSYENSEYAVIDLNFNALNPVPGGFQLTEEVEEYGVWVEGESAIGGEVDLSVGLRFVAFDYIDNEPEVVSYQLLRAPWLDIPLPDGDRLLPRAAVTWKPSGAVSLRLSAGSGFSAPEPIFDEVCCGRKYRNNRGMRTEKSESYGLEVTYQPSPAFRFGGSIFVNDFEDQIIRIAPLANGYRVTYQNVNVPESRFENLSLETSWTPNDWVAIKGSVSWLETENRTAGDAIPVLVDFFNTPVWKDFITPTIPFVNDRRGAASVTLTPPGTGLTIVANTQYTGPKQIQGLLDELEFFPDGHPNADLGNSQILFDQWYESEDFWVTGFSLAKAFRNGVSIFGGVDNITDYVQSDLGVKYRDHNWGPLRGRYWFTGMRYHFKKR